MKQLQIIDHNIVTTCSIIAFYQLKGQQFNYGDIGDCDALIAEEDDIDTLKGLLKKLYLSINSASDIVFLLKKNALSRSGIQLKERSVNINGLENSEPLDPSSNPLPYANEEHENVNSSPESVENQTFQCKQCYRFFKSVNSLKGHFYRCHFERDVNYQCSYCPRVFNRKSELIRHSQVHQDPTAPSMHVCSTCMKEFKHARNLKVHLKKHSNLITYLCPLCGKALSSQSNLNEHTKRVHSGNEDGVKYKCPTCSKCFNNKSNLVRHARTLHNQC